LMLAAADSSHSEAPPARHAPVRTCAGCKRAEDSSDLLRLAVVLDHEPPLVPDIAGRLGGRGTWVHANRRCVVQAADKGGFARSLRQPVRMSADDLCDALSGQIERRATGLLSAAVRRRAVALGTDAVRVVLTAGAPKLLVVAKDAAGRRDELSSLAHDRGCPTAILADKSVLGRVAGRMTLGILAVLDAGIADEIGACARQLAGLAEGR
jgi:predicted RNA-binding protein YlxR (DUF448 family)/ribosomal protein L30E